MYNKMCDGFVGYGITLEEADLDARCNVVLRNPNKVVDYFDFYNFRINKLSPWNPMGYSMHFYDYYLTVKEEDRVKYIVIKKGDTINKYKVGNGLFETLYISLHNIIKFKELCLMSDVISRFLVNNNIIFRSFNNYQVIIPEDNIDYNNIRYRVDIGEYVILYYNDNSKISMKRKDESYFWTTILTNNTVKEILYYISYAKGYYNMDKYLR